MQDFSKLFVEAEVPATKRDGKAKAEGRGIVEAFLASGLDSVQLTGEDARLNMQRVRSYLDRENITTVSIHERTRKDGVYTKGKQKGKTKYVFDSAYLERVTEPEAS